MRASLSKKEPRPRAERGRLVAELLTGSWRSSAPLVSTAAEDWDEIAGVLMKSGAGALAWCKVRHAEPGSDVTDQFHQAFRLQSLQAALHERSLKRVIPL